MEFKGDDDWEINHIFMAVPAATALVLRVFTELPKLTNLMETPLWKIGKGCYVKREWSFYSAIGDHQHDAISDMTHLCRT